jgi:helix-turn-helix protein
MLAIVLSEGPYPLMVGLNAIEAAARGRAAIEAMALAPETTHAMSDVTRSCGMQGWEGELCRRADGATLEQAVTMLRWWAPVFVRAALATARSRSASFLEQISFVEAEAAESLLGPFPFLDALVTDLEWLVFHCDPSGRPQLASALRRGFPELPAPRALALARALHLFRDDCSLRAWERVGVPGPLHALVLVRDEADDPRIYGWDQESVRAALAWIGERGLIDSAGITQEGRTLRSAAEAETDLLAADPWETMTESRRARALGVVQAAADRVHALPRNRGPE